MSTVQMSDGREVDFGEKRKALYNVRVSEAGLRVDIAFRDGEYRAVALEPGLALIRYAAIGMRHTLQKLDDSHHFDEVLDSLLTGPLARATRAPKVKVSPLGLALAELKGTDSEAAQAFLDSRSRKERFAISRDPRVAPILARMLAEEEERKAAKKAAKGESVEEQPDLLAGLGE